MSYAATAPQTRVVDRFKRIFARPEPVAGGDAGTAPSWQQRVFSEVGDFLNAHRLDPTPGNYDLGFQIRVSPGSRLADAVSNEIAKAGALSNEAAERIFIECGGSLSAEALADYTQKVDAEMHGLSRIISQTGKESTAFAESLESGAASDPKALMAIAASMAERARAAEAELRTASVSLAQLTDSLAEAQRVADKDPLTELQNRRALKRSLENALAECRTRRTPLSIVFCDIDHFKRINDEFGHDAGDRVLRYIAQKLSEKFANDGVVARFGGEEFVVLLAGATLKSAHKAIDDFRQELAERTLYTAGDKRLIGNVTISAGVTAMKDGDQSSDLLRRADEALYRGKEAGRNRVMFG